MPDDTSRCALCDARLPADCRLSTCEACAGNLANLPCSNDSRNPVAPISRHRILEQIAQGGMGVVHRARQDSLQRDVAVKIVDTPEGYDESLDRFAREARVLALLDHPNIVPIYDYGTAPSGRRAYTMKLVRGRTLEDMLAKLRDGAETATLQRLLRIFRKVCDAIGFAHSRGIIHRDLKPANVMVGEFGEVLVVDWGLAANLSEINGEPFFGEALPVEPRGDETGSCGGLTLYGAVLGTPEYMSPEQAYGTVRVDERTDIYALGGILYAILTLRPPIARDSYDETIEDVRRGRIEPFGPVDHVAPERTELWRIPPALLAVVRKAMARERDKRFASVGELAADVDAYLGGFATSAEQVGLTRQLWLLIKRHRALSAAALILVGVSAAFVAGLVASERRANKNEKTARLNEEAAREAERLARENEESARTALAHARTLQAESAYAANDTRQMREALDAVPRDLRDAQWHYLHERADERQAILHWQGDSFLVGSTPHPSKPGVFTVATNGPTHRIVDFDAKTGEVLKSFSYGDGWVRALAYSPDGGRIAVGRIEHGDISIHDAEDGREIIRWDTDWVAKVQFLPDGERLLQSRISGSILWDAKTGREIWRSPHGKFHFLLPDGERFLSISENNIRIHDMDGSVLQTYPAKHAVPQTACLSPDGETLVLAYEDGHIQGLRVEDGSTGFATAAGEDGDVRRMAFTPDGQRILTVAALEESGQSIRILEASSGRLLRRLRGGSGGVESMTIHPLSEDLLITCEASATWALPRQRRPAWQLEPGLLGGFFGGNDQIFSIQRGDGLAASTLADGKAQWRPMRKFVGVAATDFEGKIGIAQAVDGPRGGRDFVVFRADQPWIKGTATLRFETDARVIAVNCDGTRAAVAAAWGEVAAYRTDTGEGLPKIDRSTLEFTNGLAWHGKDPEKLIGDLLPVSAAGASGCRGMVDRLEHFDGEADGGAAEDDNIELRGHRAARKPAGGRWGRQNHSNSRRGYAGDFAGVPRA